MAINLIDILRNSFTEKSYQDLSQHVAISPEATKNGVRALVPTVLACILGNNYTSSSTEPTWWNALKDEYPYADDEYIDCSHINNPSFLIKGREILMGLYRTNYDDLVKSISDVSGIQKVKAAGLIEVGVPLIIGYLNNWLRKKGWKFHYLIENLILNRSSIVEALPPGTSPAHFGISTMQKNNFTKPIETEKLLEEAPPKKNINALLWILSLAGIALLLWYIIGPTSCERDVREVRDIIISGENDTLSDAGLNKAIVDETYYIYGSKLEL